MPSVRQRLRCASACSRVAKRYTPLGMNVDPNSAYRSIPWLNLALSASSSAEGCLEIGLSLRFPTILIAEL